MYKICNECGSKGTHTEGGSITIGLHLSDCPQNPKNYDARQSESEKFFAHLNNGGEIYVNGNGLGDFLIKVLHPKAGGE